MLNTGMQEEYRPEDDPAMDVKQRPKEAGPPAKRQKTLIEGEQSDSVPMDEPNNLLSMVDNDAPLPTQDVEDVGAVVIDGETQDFFFERVRAMSLETRTAVEALYLNMQTPASPVMDTNLVVTSNQHEAQEPVAGPSGQSMSFYHSLPHDYTCKGQYAIEEALAAALGTSVPPPVQEPILDPTACFQELEAGFNFENYVDGGDGNQGSAEFSEKIAAIQLELFELVPRGFTDEEPDLRSVSDLQTDHTSQPSVDEPAVLAGPINIPVEESLALPVTGYYIPASQNPLFIGEPAADEVGEQSAVAFPEIGDNAPTGEVAVIDEPAAMAVSVPANKLVAMREPRAIAVPMSNQNQNIPAEEVLIMGEPQGDYDPLEEDPIMGQPTAVAVPDHGNYVPADELLSMDDPGDFISQALGPMNESQLFVDQVAGPSRPLRAHAVQLYQRGGVGEPHTCFITTFPVVNLEPDETQAQAGPMAAAARATDVLVELLGPAEEDEGEVSQTAASLLPAEGRLDTIAEALRSAAISFTTVDMEGVGADAMQREPASSGFEYASTGYAPTADDYIVNNMSNDVPQNEVIPGTPEIAADDGMNAGAMQREPASSRFEYASPGSAPTADDYIVNNMPNDVPQNEVIPGTPEIAADDGMNAGAMQREPASSRFEYASPGSAPTADDYIVNNMPNDVPQNEVIPGTPEIAADDGMNAGAMQREPASSGFEYASTGSAPAADDYIVNNMPKDVPQNEVIPGTPETVMNNSPTKKDADKDVTNTNTVATKDVPTTKTAPNATAASDKNVAVVAADTDLDLTAATPPLEMNAAANESTTALEPTPFETVFAANELVTTLEPTTFETVFAADESSTVPETTPFETVSAAEETTAAPETTPFETVSAAEESTVSTTNIEAVSVGIVSTAATMLFIPTTAAMKSSAVAAEAICDDTSTKIKAKPTADDSSAVESAIHSSSAIKDDPLPSRKFNRRKRAAKPKGKTRFDGDEQKTTPMILRSFVHK